MICEESHSDFSQMGSAPGNLFSDAFKPWGVGMLVFEGLSMLFEESELDLSHIKFARDPSLIPRKWIPLRLER